MPQSNLGYTADSSSTEEEDDDEEDDEDDDDEEDEEDDDEDMEDDDNDNGVRSRDGDDTYNEKLAKFKSQQGFRITEAEQDILGRVCCILDVLSFLVIFHREQVSIFESLSL